MRRLACSVACSLLLVGCIDDSYDPSTSRLTGEEARSRIVQLGGRGAELPKSAAHFYCYDGGNVFGSIEYVSFECDSRDDCWAAVKSLGAPEPSEFKPWAASRYAVVMEGPGFYHESHREDPWDVRGIRDGVVHEAVRGGNEWMDYYAIDFDRNRVYFHHESGGFRVDEYRPDPGER